MGILFQCGFEEQDEATLFEQFDVTISTEKPRTGTRGLKSSGWGQVYTGNLSAYSRQMVCGIAWYHGAGYGTVGIHNFMNKWGTLLIELREAGSGLIYVNNNQGNTLVSGDGARCALNAWNYIEMACSLQGSTAQNDQVIVWLNGEKIIDYQPGWDFWSHYGHSTPNGDSTIAGWKCGHYGGWSASNFTYGDDLYVATGLVPYGDVGIYRMHLTGNDSVTWTATGTATGTFTNWECVDDTTFDDEATYVTSGNLGDRDIYTLENVPTGTTIHGVSATMRGQKTATGNRAATISLIAAGNESTGRKLWLPLVGWKTDFLSNFDEKPGGGAWDATSLDELKVAIEVTE